MWLKRVVVCKVTPADLILIQEPLNFASLCSTASENEWDSSCESLCVSVSQSLQIDFEKLHFCIRQVKTDLSDLDRL